MSRLFVFGLGILCGMVLQLFLISLYITFKKNNIDKK